MDKLYWEPVGDPSPRHHNQSEDFLAKEAWFEKCAKNEEKLKMKRRKRQMNGDLKVTRKELIQIANQIKEAYSSIDNKLFSTGMESSMKMAQANLTDMIKEKTEYEIE